MTDQSHLSLSRPFKWFDLELFDHDPMQLLSSIGLPPLPSLLLPLQHVLSILLERNASSGRSDSRQRERIDRSVLSNPERLEAAVATILAQTAQAGAPHSSLPDGATPADLLRILPALVAHWKEGGSWPWHQSNSSLPAEASSNAAAGFNKDFRSLTRKKVGLDGTIGFQMKFLDELPFEVDLLDLAALGVLLALDCSVRLYLSGDDDTALMLFGVAASASHSLRYFSASPEQFFRLLDLIIGACNMGRQEAKSRLGAKAATRQKDARWAHVKFLALPVLRSRTSPWGSVNEALDRTLAEVEERLQNSWADHPQLKTFELKESTYRSILTWIKGDHPDLFLRS